MSMQKDSTGAARPRLCDRYGPQAQLEAEARHLLYLTVRGHLQAGWDQLPEGLTRRNLRDLAIMAKVRRDHRIRTLCEEAAAQAAPSVGADRTGGSC